MLANFVLTNAMVTNAQCPHSGLNYLSIEMNGINNSPLNQAGTWHQIFGDEFLAPPLATTWSIGRGNLRNQVCAAGNTANVYVNGGYLNITATDEDTAGYNFSTGEVYSMAYPPLVGICNPVLLSLRISNPEKLLSFKKFIADVQWSSVQKNFDRTLMIF